jgi:tRNA dimethylallyltransferase
MGKVESFKTSAAKPPLALIAGPTASGKSDLAVRLALALIAQGRPATVINADSAQVYADLQVLSARPDAAEMQGVPHRLFGEWDGAAACSAADWAARARNVIAEVHAAGGVPVLVGGTGLYLQTLLDGIAPIPPIDPAIRDHARTLPVADAYALLQQHDSERAAQLAPNDRTRVARALEVVLATGRTLAAWQQERSGGIAPEVALTPLVLTPPRDWLYARCDQRFAAMLSRGAIAEVEQLLARQLDPDLPVMRAIGVPEIAAFLRGTLDHAAMLRRGQQATRNYAKRQYTWLRGQTPPDWLRLESHDTDLGAIFARLFQH